MRPKLKLHVPGLREMDYRRRLLAQPETMAYNRGQPVDAPGYDVATGCIDFPMSDWRFWRDIWLWREPSRYSAYLFDEDLGAFVGEVVYYYDMESDAHGTGVLIEHAHRNRGCGCEGLRLLAEHAFARPEVERLFAELPLEREAAVRMYLTAGFREVRVEGGICRLELDREEK